jgi:hypothetical protein
MTIDDDALLASCSHLDIDPKVVQHRGLTVCSKSFPSPETQEEDIE